MPEAKTKPTKVAVDTFIDSLPDESVRDDCRTLVKIMSRVSGERPKMWGPSIVGFGQYHYKYESGHEGDSCLTGFSPRKGKFSLYLWSGFREQTDLLEKLGKYKGSKGCLYIKGLADVDEKVLEKLIAKSLQWVKRNVAAKK